jgi:hypothetical protein
MNITKHAQERIKQRGINTNLIDYMKYFLPSKYENQCNKILLTKKNAAKEAKKIRAFANIIEKSGGTELLLDTKELDLITVYRRTSRK